MGSDWLDDDDHHFRWDITNEHWPGKVNLITLEWKDNGTMKHGLYEYGTKRTRSTLPARNKTEKRKNNQNSIYLIYNTHEAQNKLKTYHFMLRVIYAQGWLAAHASTAHTIRGGSTDFNLKVVILRTVPVSIPALGLLIFADVLAELWRCRAVRWFHFGGNVVDMFVVWQVVERAFILPQPWSCCVCFPSR